MFVFFEKIAESFASKAELKPQLLPNKELSPDTFHKSTFFAYAGHTAGNNKVKP